MEALGSDRFSYAALNGLDRQLISYIKTTNGFFIEAGANDGFSQSNTYYLERFRNWRGLLIEPIPELYELCRRFRARSIVYNCMLGKRGSDGQSARMYYSDLMSVAENAVGLATTPLEHAKRGTMYFEGDVFDVIVPVRTLDSILTEIQPARIDLLSLDVEGSELDVLDGLDMDMYPPEHILIETRAREMVDVLLKPRYDLLACLSCHDYLYRRRSAWISC